MRQSLLAGLAGILCSFQLALADSASATPLHAALSEIQERYGPEAAGYLPALDDRELERLASGKTVVRDAGRITADGEDIDAMSIYGWGIIHQPRLLVWLATFDGVGGERPKRYTSVVLDRQELGSYVRYQHVDLPWPFADRHWVIQLQKDLDAARVSDGQLWLHHWSLAADGRRMMEDAFERGLIEGLSRPALDESVYLPANRGAWILIEVSPDTTLVFAHFAADLGGHFPRALVRSFTARRVRAGMQLIEDLSRQVAGEYDADPVIYDGFGQPIDPVRVRPLALREEE